MRITSIQTSHGEELAFRVKQGLLPISAIHRRTDAFAGVRTLDDVWAKGGIPTVMALGRAASEGGWSPNDLADESSLLVPVANPGKIICVGLNYRPHIEESKMQVPDFPVLFNKFRSSLIGPGKTVTLPEGAKKIDYEAEMVVVMGRTCRNVSEDQALDFVLGYTNGNDLSARDLQFRTSQWLLGKALDGFAPIGPEIVTGEEIPDPDNLDIRCLVNGEERQHDNTRNMIFSTRFLISYLSRYMTLEPGDLIFTGTPQGVILGMPEAEQIWLKAGDKIAVEIEGLGSLLTHLA